MTIERAVRLLAGTMILISLALTVWVSHYWLLLTLFVGLNLFQSALTNWCPAEYILRALGLKQAGDRTACSFQ
ncbi:MAG: YgaP family membrane protein [Acidobacteriaceae bacterium]